MGRRASVPAVFHQAVVEEEHAHNRPSRRRRRRRPRARRRRVVRSIVNAERSRRRPTAATPDDSRRRGQAGSIAVVTIRSMARPFGRVRPRRDVVNDPAGGRRSGRGRVGRRDGGGGRERGFGRVGSSIQGDTPVDQTGVQDGQAGRGRQAGVRGRQQARDGRAVEREAVLRRAEGGDDPEVQPGLGEGVAVHLEDGGQGFEAGLRVDTGAGGAVRGFAAERRGAPGRGGRRGR